MTPLLIGHFRSLPALASEIDSLPSVPKETMRPLLLLSSPNPSSSYKRTSRCCKSSRLAPRFPFCNAPLQYDVKALLLIWRVMSPRLPWSVMAGAFYNNVRPLVFSRGKCTCRMDGCTCAAGQEIRRHRHLMSCHILRPCMVLWRSSPGMAVGRICAHAFVTQRKSFKFVLQMNTKNEFSVLAVLVSLA